MDINKIVAKCLHITEFNNPRDVFEFSIEGGTLEFIHSYREINTEKFVIQKVLTDNIEEYLADNFNHDLEDFSE